MKTFSSTPNTSAMTQHGLTRRQFLQTAVAGVATLALGRFGFGQPAPATKQKPNIVLILADDLGYADLGCQGNTDIPTPHIDAIAAQGVRCTDGYVSCPVCSPTRAGLLTGRYQQRFGHEFNPEPATEHADFGLPVEETTFVSRLQAAGYATGMVGKWHLGSTAGYRPQDRGFDEFFGFLGGGHVYHPTQPRGANAILRGKQVVVEKEYLTDAFAREAVDFIGRHRDEPFFLYLPFNATHAPLQAHERYQTHFPAIKDRTRHTFAGMLSALDDAVDRVQAALHDNALDDRTLVIFLSDNGGPTQVTSSRNDPLRGYKDQVYEGGIRIPFLLQWKGVLPVGVDYRRPIISLDLAPTILAAAGVAAENAHFDGVDLLPCITGQQPTGPHAALYWRYGRQYAVRRDNWKLVKRNGQAPELYNLAVDIGERTNLAPNRKDLVDELDEMLTTWDGQLAKPRVYNTRPDAGRGR